MKIRACLVGLELSEVTGVMRILFIAASLFRLFGSPDSGTLPKQTQLVFPNREFRKSAIHAHHEPWVYENRGFIYIVQSERMDADLSAELCLIFRLA
jgi:hypothetical protein